MKDVKYIGIRGHRGSGKNTVAFLLGNIIQWIIREDKSRSTVLNTDAIINDNVFNMIYRLWCEDIKKDESKALEEMDAPNIYLESFGDTPRILLQLLTNIPMEYFNSDYYKDHIVVNLRDFSWHEETNENDLKSLCDYETAIRGVEREGFDNSQIYLSLREFIVYFAKVCMKYLGSDVWVKSMRASDGNGYDDYYNIGTQYKIFRDIKAPSELTYVQDHGGKIIKVERPKFKKRRHGVESLENDNRYDYEVIIVEDILEDENLKKQLCNIAFELIRS